MLKVVGIGATLGFLGAVGIYFESEEPYPGYITVAGTLSGVTIAMLITTVVTAQFFLRPMPWMGCHYGPACIGHRIPSERRVDELGCSLRGANRNCDGPYSRSSDPVAPPEGHLSKPIGLRYAKHRDDSWVRLRAWQA